MSLDLTLILIKPDALRKHLVCEIVRQLDSLGMSLLGASLLQITPTTCKALYRDHLAESYYKELQEFMTSGPALAIALRGDNAISKVRAKIGHQDPLIAAPNTIRAEFGINQKENCAHSSDCCQTAEFELTLFFPHGTTRAIAIPVRELIQWIEANLSSYRGDHGELRFQRM